MDDVTKVNAFGIPLMEMARLGSEDGYDFRVYPEPLGNPSFHLVASDFEIVVTIKDLKILEVKFLRKSHINLKKGDKLSGALLKTVLNFMSKSVPHTSMTRKEYLIPVWNDNNPQYEIEPSFIQW